MLTSASKSKTTKTDGSFVRALFIAVAVSGIVVPAARAQSLTSGQGRAVVVSSTAGVMKTILTVQKVGEPVRLDDGRFEQRYEVTANVRFRFVSASGASENVQSADATREVPLAQLDGRAGYRSEFRIRAADQAALAVTAEPR